MDSINRKQLIGLGIFLVLTFLVAEAYVVPPAHEVHLPGGTALAMTSYPAPGGWTWSASSPSESLAAMGCVTHTVDSPPCTSATFLAAFPDLKQTDHTLYLVWDGCPRSNHVVGLNPEYMASSQTLVFHCYWSDGWIPTRFGPLTSGLDPGNSLFAIPTSELRPGENQVVLDYRVEHLLGDFSTESGLGSATIG